MRKSGVTLVSLAILAAACGDGTTLLPVPRVSAGNGIVASLYSDGSFEITQNGSRLLGTAPGKPLFSRQIDNDAPDDFHNPRLLDDVTFTRIDNAAVALDSPEDGVIHLTATGEDASTVLMSLALQSDNGFYGGLGERFEHADARGQIIGMQLEIDGTFESGTTDRHVPVPWFVSSKGYAVFVKSRESGAFDVASKDPNVVRGTFEGKTMDVTIVVDPDPLACLAKLAQMTGLPRATPRTVLGPMLWRHVDSEAQLFSDLAEIRTLKIPTSTFWIDDGWQTGLDTLHFDATKYPDLPSVSSTAVAKGFALWGWNDPYLERPENPPANEAQELYPTADAAGYFVHIADGQSFDAPGSNAKAGFGMIDFTNPAARSFWASRVSDAVTAGFHGFKLDYAEDGVPDLLNGRLGLRYFDGTTDRTARQYPLGYHGAYRDGLAQTADGGVLIVRASTYGGAAVADVIWPGDLDNGFQHRGDPGAKNGELVGGLPASIIAGQTLAASGFPLYGADVAGYRGDMPSSESLLRWAEASALSMVMQCGPGEKKYPWLYDAQTVVTYTQLAALHQKIVPYLATLLANAQRDGTPTIRSLPLSFPSDPAAIAAADDEYMLGPSLLAAPVVVEGATARQVHLPPGTWFSWWDGTRTEGPVNVTLQAPLGQPPLFVRAGAIIAELPDGIDTLFPATDPSTVSIDALAGFAEASAWVSGNASATTYDGGQIAITDDASGVGISWTPKGPAKTLTMTVDLAARTGKVARLTTVTGIGSTNVRAALSQTDVTGSTDTAAFLSGNMLFLRFVGGGAVILQ